MNRLRSSRWQGGSSSFARMKSLKTSSYNQRRLFFQQGASSGPLYHKSIVHRGSHSILTRLLTQLGSPSPMPIIPPIPSFPRFFRTFRLEIAVQYVKLGEITKN